MICPASPQVGLSYTVAGFVSMLFTRRIRSAWMKMRGFSEISDSVPIKLPHPPNQTR